LRIKDWKACDFCGRSGEVSEHYIEFRGVSKAFDDHLVLDDVSFFVDRGETCVIMGRSGVGKSVTLKHIMGFLKPDEGRVIVAGEEDRKSTRLNSSHSQISYAVFCLKKKKKKKKKTKNNDI